MTVNGRLPFTLLCMLFALTGCNGNKDEPKLATYVADRYALQLDKLHVIGIDSDQDRTITSFAGKVDVCAYNSSTRFECSYSLMDSFPVREMLIEDLDCPLCSTGVESIKVSKDGATFLVGARVDHGEVSLPRAQAAVDEVIATAIRAAQFKAEVDRRQASWDPKDAGDDTVQTPTSQQQKDLQEKGQ